MESLRVVRDSHHHSVTFPSNPFEWESFDPFFLDSFHPARHIQLKHQMSTTERRSASTAGKGTKPLNNAQAPQKKASTTSDKNSIRLLVCQKPCDRSSATEVTFDLRRETLRTLKETVSKVQFPDQSTDQLDLVYWNQKDSKWISLDRVSASMTLDQLELPEKTIISMKHRVEKKSNNSKLDKTKPSEVQHLDLSLRLCLKPKNMRETVPLQMSRSHTVGQLRQQAYGKFNLLAKQRPIYIWNNMWTQFPEDMDSSLLGDIEFPTDAYISIDLGRDHEDVVVPPGLSGLTNLGNTCFMNSALQCFSHIPELTQQILALSKDMDAPVLGEYSRLMRQIWSGRHEKVDTYCLLQSIKEYLPRYGKYRQQDAQEFMNYFLQVLHEEFTDQKTIISDLFYGRLQSQITCLQCKNIEKKEDVISFLPIPLQNHNATKTFLLVRADGEQSLHTLFVDSSITDVGDLVDTFIEQTKIKLRPENIQVIELVNHGLEKKHSRKTYLDETNEQYLVFREIPAKLQNQKIIECTFCDHSTKKPFRPPVAILCPLEPFSYGDIQENIDALRGHLWSITDAPESSIHLSWTDLYGDEHYLDTKPFYRTILEKLDGICIQLESKWVDIYRQKYDPHGSIEENSLRHMLKDFFTENHLSGEYDCSKCKALTKAKQVFRFSLPLPNVLIIQLKRFARESNSNEKIDSFIRFPLDGLDVRDWLVEDSYEKSSSRPSSTIYDLLAVSNHTGTLESGHYTTYAKHVTSGQWYLFDDSFVKKLNRQDDVITKSAYVLMYVLRKQT